MEPAASSAFSDLASVAASHGRTSSAKTTSTTSHSSAASEAASWTTSSAAAASSVELLVSLDELVETHVFSVHLVNLESLN